jgi:hypothetical protein
VYIANGGQAWVALSDERLKKDIYPIANALDKVDQLRTVHYKFLSDKFDKPHVGCIAQDVEAVLPEAVDTNSAGYKGVAYTDLVPLALGAIKELRAIVKSQASRIDQLEATIASMAIR